MARDTTPPGRDMPADRRAEATGAKSPYSSVDSTGRLRTTGITLGILFLVGLLVLAFFAL